MGSGGLYPNEKAHVKAADVVVISIAVVFLLPICFASRRVLRYTEQLRVAKLKRTASVPLPYKPTTALRKNWVFSFLSQFDMLSLVDWCVVAFATSYFVDLFSWTYFVLATRWDAVVVIADGVSQMIRATAIVLLLLIFAKRCHDTFNNATRLQHSERTYVLCVVIPDALCAAIGVFMAACYWALQWKWLGYASVSFALCLSFSTALSTWLFVAPLRKLAIEMDSREFVAIVSRLTVASSIALFTTVLNCCFAAVGSGCDFGIALYVYYATWHLDVFVNIVCLGWTLKPGVDEYMKCCGPWHRFVISHLKLPQQLAVGCTVKGSVEMITDIGSKMPSAAPSLRNAARTVSVASLSDKSTCSL